MAHARRKFFELRSANESPIAEEALRRIGELYAIESMACDREADARARLRREQALPLQGALHAWLTATRHALAEGSGIARTIDYSAQALTGPGPLCVQRRFSDRQ